MDQDDDEFLYGDASSAPPPNVPTAQLPPASSVVPGLAAGAPPPKETLSAPPVQSETEELEEGEEEEEEIEVSDDEDEIELVIERKDGSRPEPPPRPERYNQIRTASARPASAAPSKPSPSASPVPVPAVVPAVATSKLDINAMPAYNGTPINKVSMESDLLPSEKPWRKPGADVTDYFNYGFDEFTWTAYCQKQEGLREEFNPTKMMEQMMIMSGMGMGMMPGMDPSQMGDMAAMMAGGFGMQQGQGGPGGPGVGPPQGPSAPAGGQGMDMMGDPSMYMGVGAGQSFDGRGGPQDGAYNMGRGGMPPQGPAGGQMGGYVGYGAPGGFNPRGRGTRRW